MTKDLQKKQRGGLPSLDIRGLGLSAQWEANKGKKIPNASLIYGIGAALLFAVALYFLFTGGWLVFFLLLLPTGALFGYALHFLRFSS